MTTQSQRNRDATIFLVSQNAVIEAPKPPQPPPISAAAPTNNKQRSREGPSGKNSNFLEKK